MAISSMVNKSNSSSVQTVPTNKLRAPFHSNLDDLLLHQTPVAAPSYVSPGAVESPTTIPTSRTFNFMYSSSSSGQVNSPAAGPNYIPQPVIDNTDYNLNSLGGESLLLDAFYENLLRQNAARSVSRENASGRGQVGEEEEIPSRGLHLDVTKLAAINSSTAAEIAAVNAAQGACTKAYPENGHRCPTVTKKRIDSRNQTTSQLQHHVSPSSTDRSSFEFASSMAKNQQPSPEETTKQQTMPPNRQLSETSTNSNNSSTNEQKINGQVNNRKATSPHVNLRHKIVKTEITNLSNSHFG